MKSKRLRQPWINNDAFHTSRSFFIEYPFASATNVSILLYPFHSSPSFFILQKKGDDLPRINRLVYKEQDVD